VSFNIEIKVKNERISQKKNSTNRLGNSRTISQKQSLINSKQSSPVSHGNFDINEPIKLRSIYGKDVLSILNLDVI